MSNAYGCFSLLYEKYVEILQTAMCILKGNEKEEEEARKIVNQTSRFINTYTYVSRKTTTLQTVNDFCFVYKNCCIFFFLSKHTLFHLFK